MVRLLPAELRATRLLVAEGRSWHLDRLSTLDEHAIPLPGPTVAPPSNGHSPPVAAEQRD